MKSSKLQLTLGFALACAAFLSTAGRAQAQTVTFLGVFNGTNGSSPNELIQGTDGNLYGSAFGGSNFNQGGEIFRVTPSGEISIVFNFSGAEGYDPYILVLGSDGNFYGINIYGGDSIAGIFYKVTPGGEFTPLHEFCAKSDCIDGHNPNGLFLGFDGNFYGTTAYGGNSNQGVFFRVSPTGKFKVLHSFCSVSNCQDGNFPLAPIQGQDGNFYGVTAEGGTAGTGVIYKLTPRATTR